MKGLARFCWVALFAAFLLVPWAIPRGWAQISPALTTTPSPRVAYLPVVFGQPGASITPTSTEQQDATPTSLRTITPTNTVTATQQRAPSITPSATSSSQGSGTFPTTGPGTPTRTPTNKPIFTNGQDLWNCSDFATWDDANVVYQANGPGDPNRLDQDDDGIPCETLPGAPTP